jgi:hypothetical protein
MTLEQFPRWLQCSLTVSQLYLHNKQKSLIVLGSVEAESSFLAVCSGRIIVQFCEVV